MSKPKEPKELAGGYGTVITERGYPPTLFLRLSIIRSWLRDMADNIIEDDEDEGD